VQPTTSAAEVVSSAIKMAGHFFFSAFGQTPPLLPLVRDPRSATPLAVSKDGLCNAREKTGHCGMNLPRMNVEAANDFFLHFSSHNFPCITEFATHPQVPLLSPTLTFWLT